MVSNFRHKADMRNYVTVTIICILIFATIFVISEIICDYRENQCSEKCIRAGAKSYEYKDFSGYGIKIVHLKEDSCSCAY